MSDWTANIPQAARDYIANRRLDEVECLVSDLAGVAKGKAMPASKFGKQKFFHLPNSIYAQTITGDYADMADGNDFTEPDMILKPDFATATAVPWTADWTLQVIHDAFDQKGNPVAMAPRNVLKRVRQLYEDQGWKAIVAPEMEFFLVARNTDPNQPIIPPMGRSGRRVMANQAYSMSAVDEYGKVIDDIYDFAEAQGFEIDGIVQEGGAGQVEINLNHGDPVSLADEVFYFKRLIREAALRHDCFATFMAKPIEGEPGSAMHIHQSVVDAESGQNIFSTPQGDPSPEFFAFIAGQQRYLPQVMCVLAPYVNSYRRLARGSTAPINTHWGYDNRTVGIRIPPSGPNARRVENRVPSSDANPYLAIAASLAAGLLGIEEGLTPAEPIVGSARELPHELPRGLHDAVELFAACEPIHELLGDNFVTVYSEIKREELETFMRVISPWEREYLLLNV